MYKRVVLAATADADDRTQMEGKKKMWSGESNDSQHTTITSLKVT